nr:MFS transporter [Saccharopolyspora sp. HNM0983]
MISIDMTVLYTALPTLAHDLQTTATQKLWIINAYPLVMAGLLLGAGTLGDRVGHRRMYLIGLVLFGAASLLAAYAPAAGVLIGARAFLAVGAAAMMPATLSLIRITFTDERERGIAIGVWGTIAMVGAALGPVVGGLLLEHFWWGSVFLINVPIVLAALLLALSVAPRSTGDPGKPWDLVGSLQVMVGLVGLVYAIKDVTSPAPSAFGTGLALLAAAGGFWTFVRRQRAQPHPLIDFGLFRNPLILIGVLAAGMATFVTAGAELVLTQRLQLVLEMSPLQAGLVAASMAVGAMPVGIGAGAVLHRTGTRPVIVLGLLVAAVASLGVLLVSSAALLWTVVFLALAGAGAGAAMTAASAAIVGNAPAHRAGMASSVEEVSYEFGSLCGVAVLGSLITAVYTGTFAVPDGLPAGAADSMDRARLLAEQLPAEQAGILLREAGTAFDNAYRATLLVAVLVLLAAAAFSALHQRRAPRPTTADSADTADTADATRT